MKAAQLIDDRNLVVREVQDPVLLDQEVLVESGFAGICGTDIHIYRGEFHDRVSYPAILGHEFGGIIREVGKGVRKWKAGDRVVVDPILSCHSCPACLSGHINACRTLKLLGVDQDGGMGQLIAAPASQVYSLPDNVLMEHAPMVEMYGLGHHILSRGQVQPGETVVILGAGKLGLSVLDVLCHSAGPGWTAVTDLSPFRLETARKLGADHLISVEQEDPVARILELTQGVGVDCVIECIGHYHNIAGQEPPLQQAVRMIRSGGRIVNCGLGEQPTPFHFKTLVIKEAQLIASRVTRGEFPRALRLMAKGLLHPQWLVTEKVDLRDAAQAFAKVDGDDPATIKVVVDVQAG
ncbi:MAG: alcohol dehydrogenase catalytic domain-containing protein [Syntrophales bacterium LBB04]|nr:alcohol dehydrogenase catalytic domain-containing protein [Syntrophales bacterium LBB04]